MIKICGLALGLFLLAAAPAHAAILDIKEVKSPAGITAWLVEDHTVPVISFRFGFKDSGAVNDPEDKQGLSQLLSNTMDEGAGELDSRAFQETLTDNSISLSFGSSRDDFGGSVKTLAKKRALAFDLLAMALTAPRFDADAVERMRQANLSRIKGDMSDPEWIAARLLNDTLYTGHPYARNAGGTLSSLPRITPDDLRQKVKTQLTRDRLLISVAGDITAEQLAPELDKIFAKLPASAEKIAIAEAALPAQSSVVLYKKDIPQTVIQIAGPGIAVSDKDYFAAEILNYTLGGAGFGSRLMDVIREKGGLTYGIYSGLSRLRHSDLFMIRSSTKNETAQKLIDMARAEIKTITHEPISPAELQVAKTYLIGSVPLDLTSTDQISGYMQALQSENLPPNYLDIREAALKAVTAQDVTHVAARLLDPAKMTVILVGAPQNIKADKLVVKLPNVE